MPTYICKTFLVNQMMRYKPAFYLLLLSSGALLSSCDDIIEPNITKEVVTLLTPADSAISTSTIQTFRWELVDGVRQYHVQLARPSFDNPSAFLLDTLTAKTSFATPLTPGTYHWRVQAVNSSYKTAYSSRVVRIDSTGNLGGQQFLLLQPANNAVTANTSLTFSWASLPMAEHYILHLQPSPRGTASSFDTLLSTTPSVLIRMPRQSRTYQWKVSAINSFSAQQSASQVLEVDVTPPAFSSFSAPAENAFFLNLPITLTWNRNSTDVIRDSVYLYRADKQTLVTAFPRLSTSTALTLSAGTNQLQPGTYHWALRSFDRAGNRSALSPFRSFILQ